MKRKNKLFGFVLFALMTAAVAVTPALAQGPMYCIKDGAKVMEAPDRDSEVLQTLYLGQQVLTFEESSNGYWVNILCPAFGNDGQKEGWVRTGSLSDTLPQSLCNHSFNDWTITKQPTCTEPGYRVRYCTICGLMDEDEIPMTGHNYGNWTVYQQPTCTQEGQQYTTCTECGHEEWQSIPKLPHSFSDWRVTKPASCTAEGERIRTCSVCGYQETQIVEKLPHSYGEWTVLKQPTCTEEGTRKHTCQICGYESTEQIEKIPHDFEWTILTEATDHSSGIRTNVCKVCGYREEEVSYDPEGTLRRGDRGEEVREIQQLLADQNYLSADGADGIFGGGTEKAIMTFQNDQGFTADGVAWPQTIKRLHHDFGEWKTIKQFTRDSQGERVRSCKDCSYEQHEFINPEPMLERGDRSEKVRAVQQMLSSLGYDAGSYDGIYGQLLDNAFGQFAEAKKLKFEQGKIYPAGLDALVNAWIESLPEENFMGVTNMDSPVDLVLTVTPVAGSSESEEETKDDDKDITTYKWTLTNMGEEECIFTTVLLNYGDDPDFKENNLVMELDGQELKAKCENSVSGIIKVSKDWGEGKLNFSALAISGNGQRTWLSNIETF